MSETKTLKQTSSISRLEFGEYILKCLVGVSIGYLLLRTFPQQSGQSLWLLISILLSITHDNNSKVAYDRMKANVLGSVVGLFAFFLHDPANLLTISIGVTITIAICFWLKLMDVSRTALVALIIVVFFDEAHRSWSGALERVASVVAGCVIGLVINFIFRNAVTAIYGPVPSATASVKPPEKEKPDGGE